METRFHLPAIGRPAQDAATDMLHVPNSLTPEESGSF
ncbi:hypothetical protein RCH14_002785 [Massilia sp. MP_M2]